MKSATFQESEMGLGIRDLRVWQEATALASEILRDFSDTRAEARAFTDRTIVTAAAVAEHTAAAFARSKLAEREVCFRAAKTELLKLETQLEIARAAELLPKLRHEEFFARISTVKRLLAGFLAYLDRETNEAGGANLKLT